MIHYGIVDGDKKKKEVGRSGYQGKGCGKEPWYRFRKWQPHPLNEVGTLSLGFGENRTQSPQNAYPTRLDMYSSIFFRNSNVLTYMDSSKEHQPAKTH